MRLKCLPRSSEAAGGNSQNEPEPTACATELPRSNGVDMRYHMSNCSKRSDKISPGSSGDTRYTFTPSVGGARSSLPRTLIG